MNKDAAASIPKRFLPRGATELDIPISSVPNSFSSLLRRISQIYFFSNFENPHFTKQRWVCWFKFRNPNSGVQMKWIRYQRTVAFWIISITASSLTTLPPNSVCPIAGISFIHFISIKRSEIDLWSNIYIRGCSVNVETDLVSQDKECSERENSRKRYYYYSYIMLYQNNLLDSSQIQSLIDETQLR